MTSALVNGRSDTLTFLRAWISAPLRVASAIPSSESLAEIITRDITPESGPVLELGPGTGVFTRALIRRGIHERNLTLVELGPEFADLLARRHPEATLLRIDARELGTTPVRLHGAAVSGLPLLSMSRDKVIDIVQGAFRCLEPGAPFFQFTYGPRSPVPRAILRQLGMSAIPVGFTLRNFPPATVYKIIRNETANPSEAAPTTKGII